MFKPHHFSIASFLTIGRFFQRSSEIRFRSLKMVIAISLSVSLLIPALPTVAAIRTVPSSSQQRDGATYTVLPQSLAVLRRGA